jgi:hypothetical protein
VVLEERIESVTCRWCGATDDRIERVGDGDAEPPVTGEASGAPFAG